MIELRNLSCSFEKKVIFEKLCFVIEKDLTILGANGAGKSTLAKALCNLMAFEGEILLNNLDIRLYDPKTRAKKIAYIPTKLELYDEFLTLEEFVLLGRFPHKENFLDYTQKDHSIAEKNMQLLGIQHLAKHKLADLSSGETALALIAQALTQESEIIIFDEPTANLDPKNSKIIAHHIKALQKSHQVILITHDIHLAHFINTPVLFLKEKKAHLFKDNFFQDDTLSALYEVTIHSLAVQYD